MNEENNLDMGMELEPEIIELNDAEGNPVRFEVMDVIEYQGHQYLVLFPEGVEEVEALILRMEAVDDETANYYPVDDDFTTDAVFGIFKENNKDYIIFDDEDASADAGE